ncbi:dTMP kinase [Pseudomonas akapageensis]|uniref:dTMP kinase n=1 Tax=Pseudomonas akapageensis TaxID=2609961 RepID=UPI001408B3A8|nr:AAA family ATPase [Pseudomonas akapageensis]
MKHLFVTVEGIDGAGKSTIVRMLAKRLGAVCIKTPDERFSDERQIVENQGTTEEKYAFYLRSLEAQKVEISELLEEGPVICDRYIHSTIAYQWPDTEPLPADIPDFFPSLIRPDCSILLTVSREVSRERIARREDQTGVVSPTDHNLSLLDKARRRFLAMQDLIQIDTNDRTPEQVCDLILSGLMQ